MTRAELDELREAWARAVLTYEWTIEGRSMGTYPTPCWFKEALGLEDCEGRIEGAHWIKRQTVERWVKGLSSEIRMQAIGTALGGPGITEEDVALGQWMREHLYKLAAWDPRNGVPACERHHRIFDSQRVPLPSEQIVVWRHQVPAHVEAFALDWALEHELDRKHDTIGGGI